MHCLLTNGAALALALVLLRMSAEVEGGGWLHRKPNELRTCGDPNPNLRISHDVTSGQLSDRQSVTVTVTGVDGPSEHDWIALISPSAASIADCLLNKLLYVETGDITNLPLLCHYPIKARFLSEDPSYMGCVSTIGACSGKLTFDVINIRTDVKFVYFGGGFDYPCVLAETPPIPFANPKQPLFGHLSSLDSSGNSLKLTWVSGDDSPQTVRYGDGSTAQSGVSTFQQTDMCNGVYGPASDFGWHDPGYIHSAILNGLSPSTSYTYVYGSDQAGWSPKKILKTPPASGSPYVNVIVYGDMGKTPRDNATEHFIQPGASSVVKAISNEMASGNVDMILHIGDISYATGFLVEWDFFLNLIEPIASQIPYMTGIGNHERDYPESGSYYVATDSGGECGIPYETYFPMPAQEKDRPWYSIEVGTIHFTVMSTEHDWTKGSDQFNWMQQDLASVNRTRTPWLVFCGHRPQYSSHSVVDPLFVSAVEPLLLQEQVDLALWGHVHNYERTCAVYQGQCLLMPSKDASGVDTYKSKSYQAPVHVVVGMAGFTLDGFFLSGEWSLTRIQEYGFAMLNATSTELLFQFKDTDGLAQDSFKLVKQ